MDLQPAERRRQKSRAEARRTILDAAESLLVESGFDRFSMRKLADRCGYTAPTIYHYFGDKTGLIDALLEQRLQLLVRQLRRAPRGPDPLENTRALFTAFGLFGLENPTHYRLLMIPRGESVEPPSGPVARELLEEPITTLATQGRLLVDDLELVKQALWALLHGLVALPAARPMHDWSENLFAAALDAMLRGLVRPDDCAASRGEDSR